ncbi:MAG: hypothetical protein J1E98_08380 [Lachnospiraceae bacterium]|nr:hypothetical protein [Lachnospiraceae bacterium]
MKNSMQLKAIFKKYKILISILAILCVTGVAAGLLMISYTEGKTIYPEYFAPIVQEIEASRDDIRESLFYSMNKWWEDSIGVGAYEDKVFTCYIDGEYYPFDLKDELTDSQEWEWMAAGVFYREGENRAYACLSDFNPTPSGMEPVVRNPQLLLIDFSMDDPKDYNVTPYTIEPYGEFVWVDVCYRIGNNIYIKSESAYDLGVINLNTKQFHYCVEEYSAMKEYAEKFIQEKFAGENYSMYSLSGTFEQDGVIVYSATITETSDVAPVGIVFSAYKDGKLLAYMGVDLTTAEVSDGIEVELVE